MTEQNNLQHFIVNRSNIKQAKIVAGKPLSEVALASGQVLVEIEKFALTSNNVTYAAIGEMLGYWQYFPVQEQGWGNVPVWGYATVIRSEHDDIAVGERLYGFLPMSTHLVMQPEQVTATSFSDQYEHRKTLHETYNRYLRLCGDPSHIPEFEDLRPTLFALFTTAFLLDDFFHNNEYFTASQMLLSSASAKTSVALAYLLSQREGIRCIGLTSSSNKEFVEKLGLYDQVVSYDQLQALDADLPAIYVDFAGNGGLLYDIHSHYSDKLVYSCRVGMSHWTEQSADQRDMPGAQPVLFFAPDHAAKLLKDWGEKTFGSTLKHRWEQYAKRASQIYRVEKHQGIAVLEKNYCDMVEGVVDPSVALICSFGGG